MNFIDEKFKDMPPAKTVENIKAILTKLNVEVEEDLHDSGIENCWSVTLRAKNGFPFFSNGKGVSPDFARASAYGEFIERLQSGLFFYKFQSILRDPDLNLHTFAPDAKYMNMEQLIENGQWMDHIIDTYGGGLTREKLAKQCKMYASADEDRILTLPFYSLFEGKHVYLPMGFVEQMYSANGCCAGNTREEAWVHALSEMMERKGSTSRVISGAAAPKIDEQTLRKFPTVSKILDKIKMSGEMDIEVFDFSAGNGFPVICTRLINKRNHAYNVNIGADPVLEIAIQRTLTEIFQGKTLAAFNSIHDGAVLEETKNLPLAHNVLNQLETGNGLFTIDFFTEELSCTESCAKFPDLSGKTNKELLKHMLELYRAMGKPVYVRNYSFLGFPCYKFVVPGFSESRGVRLTEPVQEYALADDAAKTLRSVEKAENIQLQMLLLFYNKIQTIQSRRQHFGRLAGLPLLGDCNRTLLHLSLSYAAYRLGRLNDAAKHLAVLEKLNGAADSDREYFSCVGRYLKLKALQLPEEKIRLFLCKFYLPQYVQRLFERLDSGKTPYDGFLLDCNCKDCHLCIYHEKCNYEYAKKVIAKTGEDYGAFVDGQRKENFDI